MDTLYLRKEAVFLDKLHDEASHNLRSGMDGWGNPLPHHLRDVPTVEGEISLLQKRLNDIEIMPEDLATKIKNVDALLTQAQRLKQIPVVSLIENLRKATRNGDVGFAPVDSKKLLDEISQQIAKTLSVFLQEGLELMGSKLQKLEDVAENQKVREALTAKQNEFRERLKELHAGHQSQ